MIEQHESELQMKIRAAESAVEAAKEEFGEDHEIVADTLDAYADLLKKASNKTLEAINAREKAQEIRRLNNPDWSPAPAPAPAQQYCKESMPQENAGFWIRLIARIIDSTLISAVFGTIVFVVAIVIGIIAAMLPEGAATLLSLVFLIGVTIVGLITDWLYFACFECSSLQATPGKLILGLKVTTLTGERIGFGRATGRFFGKIISALPLYIGFMMAGWTEKKQALHDMMCETLVVRKR